MTYNVSSGILNPTIPYPSLTLIQASLSRVGSDHAADKRAGGAHYEKRGQTWSGLKMPTLLTDKSAQTSRFVAAYDQQEVDRQTGRDDRQGYEALGRVVQQRKENEEQHDEKEENRQQQIHLQQQQLICNIISVIIIITL